jgi:hypothetical protein
MARIHSMKLSFTEHASFVFVIVIASIANP